MIESLFTVNAGIIDVPGIDNEKLADEILLNPKRKTDDVTSTQFEDTILNVRRGSESQKLIEYIINYGKDHDLSLHSYWSQIHHYLESTDLHQHGHVDFSWVYYVKVPENSGKLVLYFNENDERAPKYIMEPKESRLIIFPSYIKHKVTKHMNQDVRISISGDYLLINKQS